MKATFTTGISSVAVLLCALHGASLMAQLLSDQEMSVTRSEIGRIRASLDRYSEGSGKIRFLQGTLTQTTNSAVRQEVLRMGEAVGGDDFEQLLIEVVGADWDVDLRISAVTLLARWGTSRSIQPLLDCARSDATGEFRRGCTVGRTNARGYAYFALAELGLRLPSERERLAEAVRASPITCDADTQTMVLYMLTGEERLLRPFYERLASVDPKTRISGVVAFRFLKLTRAPKELTQLIQDSDPEVRMWVALVLGEIGDAETVRVLMDAANNKQMDRGTRCNAIYSLGRMRASDATALLQRLLLDKDVNVNAAIALSQITGERHPLVPSDYRLD